MRNNLVFKFIAILLCAASLLGIVGSIGGIIVLTEGDLYNKTVEQVKQELLETRTSSYAHSLALMYASTTLGGSPEELVEQALMTGWFEGDYGYRILDAGGNVLSAYNEPLQQTGTTFTYRPTGQYIHTVSLETEAEASMESYPYATEHPAQISGVTMTQALEASCGYAIPSGGMDIVTAIFYDQYGGVLFESRLEDGDAHCNWTQNNRSTGYAAADFEGPIGTLENNNGMVIFQSNLDAADEPYQTTPVYGMLLYGKYSEMYELYSDIPLGNIEAIGHRFVFISNLEAPDQPAAASLEEEPAGWVVETIPGEEYKLTLIAPNGTVTEIDLPRETTPEDYTHPAETTVIVETRSVPEVTVPGTEPTAADTEDVSSDTTPTQETTAEETEAVDLLIVPAMTAATEAPLETAPETTPETTEETPAATVETTETTPETTEMTLPATEPETLPPETEPEPTIETIPEETEPPLLINGRPLGDYQVNTEYYWDSSLQRHMYAEYVFVPMPELTVELYVDETTLPYNASYEVLNILRHFRSWLLPAVGICLLTFAIFAVYLCTAAGRKPKSEDVRAGGLNRIPLDLYFGATAFCIALAISYAPYWVPKLVERDILTACTLGALTAFLVCLLFVAFCFAFVAQLKTPDGFWYRNTLFGHFIRLTFRFCNWSSQFCVDKGFPLIGKACKSAWHLCAALFLWTMRAAENTLRWAGRLLGRIFRWLGHQVHRFLSLLPLTWQWLLAGMVIMLSTLLLYSHVFWLLGFLVPLCIIGYCSHCFGLLSESIKRMSKGDLDSKVDDKHMVGCFQEFAGDLNDLAGVAVVAAQKQLKSERMKTELITNVSHDIKTPLTSIINYVDLLQKPHTPEQEQQYLEVLDRQSQRLKKLIDDLMDMSKANTGNMQVDITQVDAVEAVTQALGEFADKLDRARLIPVFRHDEVSVPMMADGRLVWRVLSNLLGNAVKYAMPGTRLYIDLMSLEGKVIISLKNISREELNVDAEELMERFVRGDDSRNTEGSGLGLNIAKSLMELQKGQLQLLVDGDLFKVTLIFPGA